MKKSWSFQTKDYEHFSEAMVNMNDLTSLHYTFLS